MADRLEIPFRLPGLNEWIKDERANRFKANKVKQDTQKDIGVFIHNAQIRNTLHSHDKPCRLTFHWTEGNSRRDLDNVAFATKFIQDALVAHGVFPDDSQRYIKELHHTVTVEKGTWAVEVIIEEIKNDHSE